MSCDLSLLKKKDVKLTDDERSSLDNNITNLINASKNRRQELNRLVFDSVAAMTSAEELETALANKKGISRFVGSITGSNKALQDKINNNRAAAQYASQLMLNKLAEQNLITLDVVTVLNNKLNAAILQNDEEINQIYKGLIAFFKKSRSDIFKLETRIDKLERNVQLLNWENSIDYQQFNGVDYPELDNVSKIVCLVRDFYEITHGQWSTTDLLLLKTAMGQIGLEPRAKVNYFDIIKSISYEPTLKDKLLGMTSLPVIKDPDYLISSAALKKMEDFTKDDHYIVESLTETLLENKIHTSEKDIIESLTLKYIAQKATVDARIDVEHFDLIIDLLFNLQQLTLLSSPPETCLPEPSITESDNPSKDGSFYPKRWSDIY